MLPRVKWVASADDPADDDTLSFGLGRLDSARSSLGQVCREYRRARLAVERGDRSAIKAFRNVVLGLPGEDGAADVDALYARRERRFTLASVEHVTAGVDVQTDRLVFAVVAWSAGNRDAWILETGIVQGDPRHDGVWQSLGSTLRARRDPLSQASPKVGERLLTRDTSRPTFSGRCEHAPMVARRRSLGNGRPAGEPRQGVRARHDGSRRRERVVVRPGRRRPRPSPGQHEPPGGCRDMRRRGSGRRGRRRPLATDRRPRQSPMGRGPARRRRHRHFAPRTPAESCDRHRVIRGASTPGGHTVVYHSALEVAARRPGKSPPPFLCRVPHPPSAPSSPRQPVVYRPFDHLHLGCLRRRQGQRMARSRWLVQEHLLRRTLHVVPFAVYHAFVVFHCRRRVRLRLRHRVTHSRPLPLGGRTTPPTAQDESTP